MRLESHSSVVAAHLRHGELIRDEVTSFTMGTTFAIASGIGPPRLWRYARRAALRGFSQAIGAYANMPAPDRLAFGLQIARQSLARECSALVERTIPDAALTGLCFEDGKLHVIAAGASRVYVRRLGAPKRLTPRDELSSGLLHVDPIRSELLLQPGDLILAGTPAAFSDRAIARLSKVLDDSPDSATSVVASLLTEPRSKAGFAAAALAVRPR